MDRWGGFHRTLTDRKNKKKGISTVEQGRVLQEKEDERKGRRGGARIAKLAPVCGFNPCVQRESFHRALDWGGGRCGRFRQKKRKESRKTRKSSETQGKQVPGRRVSGKKSRGVGGGGGGGDLPFAEVPVSGMKNVKKAGPSTGRRAVANLSLKKTHFPEKRL